MENNITLFEKNGLVEMQRLRDITAARKSLETEESKAKEKLLQLMQDYEVKSFENDILKITKVAGSESVSIDTKTLEKKEPDLYQDLLQDYPKITKRSESIRITIK